MNREAGPVYAETDTTRPDAPTKLQRAPRTSSALAVAWNARMPTLFDAPPRPISLASVVLVGLWLFIGLVAAYDIYLSIKYQETLHVQELNPFGRMLLAADGGSVAIFMACKFAGTVLVLGILQVLFWYQQRLGLTVASAVAGAQALLAGYLIFG